MPRLGRLFLALCILLALPLGWLAVYAFSPVEPGAPEQIIEIHHADSHSTILRDLVEKGVIDHPDLFNWLGRVTRLWPRTKAGEYRVSASMTPLRIFWTITSGISIPHPVTVREGENMYQIADDLQSKGLASKEQFLALCRDPELISSLGFDQNIPSLEGFLYPDTYYFNKTMTAEEMIRQMVHHANQMWTNQDETLARAQGMTRYQVITLASIIEKETGAPNERAIISSVFHNRLRMHMKLQSDPTTIYGMWQRYHGKIHIQDLKARNPYNTYYVPGLPEGPISNPGKDSILAALEPANTDYLYFVSHNDGTHQFSKSLAEQDRAIRKYQLNPKMREGHSWRELSKKLGTLPKSAPQHSTGQ